MKLGSFLSLRAYSIVAIIVVYLMQSPMEWKARAGSIYSVHSTISSPLRLAGGTEDTESADSLFRRVFNEEYEYSLSELDKYTVRSGGWLTASVDKVREPYADFWFPERLGGTNGPDKDGLTPTLALDAYDNAFYGGTPTASVWERAHHNEPVSWYGHCNGFSAAAARHRNPGGPSWKPVKRPVGCSNNCIEFSPMQIRALMAEVYMNSISRFVGGHRCEKKKEELNTRPQDRVNPEVMDECEDPDPGTMHLAVLNWLARKKEVMVADFNADNEVWNYPLYKISYRYEPSPGGGKKWNEAEVMSAINSSVYNSYVYNTAAKAFAVVSMRLSYAKATDETTNVPEATLEPKLIHRSLRYVLELDDNERIIGGEWLYTLDDNGAPVVEVKHPDFLWIPFEPGKPAGNRTGGNPHVDTEEVLSMWKEAVGYNPNNPSEPVLLQAPSDKEPWGIAPSWYTTRIDSADTGAVFLGKTIPVEILPEGNLLNGSFNLVVKLNGKEVYTKEVGGDAPVQFNVEPKVGMNFLDFAWSQGGQGVPGPTKNFRFFAM